MRVGCIGVGGMGGNVTAELATFADVEIAALCDVDPVYAAKKMSNFQGLPFYKDYRVMLERERNLDAVMVGTPDHWHAPISLAAMQLGLHVYCEKPLAHTIEEARLMARVARETGVVTQMGNTGHAGEGIRPVKLVWYDGGKHPPRPAELETERALGDNGIYFVGTEGVMIAAGWSGTPRLVPESRMQTFRRPDKTLPRSVGHRREWVDACRTGKPEDAKSGFWYSAPFTESLLVGLLPVYAGKRIEWNAQTLSATNAPELDPFIRKRYRRGFDLPAGIRRPSRSGLRFLG